MFSSLTKCARYYGNVYIPCFAIITSVFFLFIVVMSIYIPFNNTYLLDEFYDGTALHPITLRDKLTIRVSNHDNSIEQLQKFVRHYSICPCVHDIKIILNNQQQQQEKEYQSIHYIFEHTHSLVTYVHDDLESTLLWETESILLLDPHVFVSCDDLKFTLSVWKSSYDSLVGYFPRSHTSTDSPNDSQDSSKTIALEYLNWWYVFWHQRYSLMLPSGVLLKKEIWESYLGSSKEALEMRSLLSSNPECYPVSLSLWSAYTSPSPPIWVDIPVTIDEFTSLSPSFPSLPSLASSSSSLRVEKTKKPTGPPLTMCECLTRLSALLHSPPLSYSFHKAGVAKNLLFW